jgi:hypothetical protein
LTAPSGKFNASERALQKQASRDEDARRLAAGETTRAELRMRNGFFSSIDF